MDRRFLAACREELQFALPKLKGIEAIIEQPEQVEPLFDLGKLTPEEPQKWHKLYDKACGSNGQGSREATPEISTG